SSFREFAELLGLFVVPLLIAFLPLYGLCKRVPVYEKFVEGAREGFDGSILIIPYLVAILFSVAMFKSSGAMQFFQEGLSRRRESFRWRSSARSAVAARSQ